jgi:hypothetical protein
MKYKPCGKEIKDNALKDFSVITSPQSLNSCKLYDDVEDNDNNNNKLAP